MLQTPVARDYLIASGQTTSLREFVRLAFLSAGLEPGEHIISDATFLRPSDLKYSAMDPSLIATDLGWRAEVTPVEIVQRMHDHILI